MNQSGQIVKLIVQLVIVVIAWVVIPRLFRNRTVASGPTPDIEARLQRAVEDALGGPRIAARVERILDKRASAHRSANRLKRLIWVSALAYGAVVVAPRIGTLPETSRTMAWGMLGFFVMNLAFTVTFFAARWSLRASRLVIILRRFGRPDRQRTLLPRIIGEALAGVAVPLTIVDASYPGEPGPARYVLSFWLVPPLALTLTVALMIVLVPLTRLEIAATVTIAIFIGSAVILHRVALWFSLLRRAARTTKLSYETVLRRQFRSIRRGRRLYTGTSVTALPDTVWREAICMALVEADAVVIDITDLSEAIGWELQATRERVPPEAVVLAWSIGEFRQIASRELLSRHLHEVLSGSADEVTSMEEIPSAIRQRLESFVPQEWYARCQKLPYEERARSARREMIHGWVGIALAKAIAHGELQRLETAGARAIAGQ